MKYNCVPSKLAEAVWNSTINLLGCFDSSAASIEVGHHHASFGNWTRVKIMSVNLVMSSLEKVV